MKIPRLQGKSSTYWLNLRIVGADPRVGPRVGPRVLHVTGHSFNAVLKLGPNPGSHHFSQLSPARVRCLWGVMS